MKVFVLTLAVLVATCSAGLIGSSSVLVPHVQPVNLVSVVPQPTHVNVIRVHQQQPPINLVRVIPQKPKVNVINVIKQQPPINIVKVIPQQPQVNVVKVLQAQPSINVVRVHEPQPLRLVQAVSAQPAIIGSGIYGGFKST